MTFEKFSNSEPAKSKHEAETKRKTSKRLLRTLSLWKEGVSKKIDVIGRENIEEIPEGRKVVIAVSHISDVDIPITTYSLGNDFDLAIVNQSIHHNFSEEASTNIGLRLAGKDNFIPIDYVKGSTGKQPRFNPENFLPMQEALETGKAVLIAAHNPSDAGEGLRDDGVGAAYLAGISNAMVLPVAVNVKSEDPDIGMHGQDLKTLLNRPDIDVIIGKPLDFQEIDGIESIKEVMAKRKSGQKLSQEDRDNFRDALEELRNRSRTITERIAALLPESKRGGISLSEE